MPKSLKPSQPPVTDLSYWWTDFNFVPSEYKESQLWFAQALFYAKLNSVPLVKASRVAKYRKLDRGEIDTQDYINLIDPPTPMGGGGKAEYFASDFKDMPIKVHLDNILKAKMDKIAVTNKLQVNEIDKFAKSQRQIDKDKTIYLREFRKLINDINKEIGLPPIKESENPAEYVRALSGKETTQKVDDFSRLIDQIKSKVVERKDWELYDRYVYKGDIERAFELAIEHYMINQNKWRIKSEFFTQDIKNFNAACGRAYTDETTGRLNFEYFSPETLYTSPFYEKNGEDVVYWFREKDIPFSEFVRQLGTTLTNEQLKEVFQLNKESGSGHGMEWTDSSTRRRNNALIRVGYFAILTQEAQKFSETYINNRIPSWEKKPLSWTPDTDSATQKQRIYNVWYSCYYIPPPGNRTVSNVQADWSWQSKYIFNIKKDVDMYHYGVDMRYAKSQLVIWKDVRMSFTDIEEAFMPKIRTVWHKFQNCLVQDTTALAIDWDFISGLLNAVDETNKSNLNNPDTPSGGNGKDAGMAAWRALKQDGIAFLKFRDKNGQVVVQDPSKFFVPISTGHLEKAEKLLEIILTQYNMMTIALAQNDVTQGVLPKPRTAVAGIEASLEAANNGIWFIEKPVREFTIMFGERVVQHVLCMVREKNKYGYENRWKEFAEVVGLAHALMVEGIEDIAPEDIGITVSLEDTEAMREYIFNLANEMAKNREVSREAVGLVIDSLSLGSWKYAYALLMLGANEQKREMQAQEEIQHQRIMEIEDKRLQTALALQNAKSVGKDQNINTQGAIDEALQTQLNTGKFQSQAALGEQRKQGKMEENAQKADLKKQETQPQPIEL